MHKAKCKILYSAVISCANDELISDNFHINWIQLCIFSGISLGRNIGPDLCTCCKRSSYILRNVQCVMLYCACEINWPVTEHYFSRQTATKSFKVKKKNYPIFFVVARLPLAFCLLPVASAMLNSSKPNAVQFY